MFMLIFRTSLDSMSKTKENFCSPIEAVRDNRPFKLVHFVLPFQTTRCPRGNFPFVFFISYAYICTCIRQHLKETIPSSSITWSEIGKQNIQAKEVYWTARGTVKVNKENESSIVLYSSCR